MEPIINNNIKNIPQLTSDAALNIALDTINNNKQALIFVSTKASAEALAERIASKIKPVPALKKLSLRVLNVLSHPTKQCKRLSSCISKGIAFHHSGLVSEQRRMIEDYFRKGFLKIITCTPTLAYGLNLPAFRVVIRDLKRYTRLGVRHIPVLEYHQFTGRAGRPGLEVFGEAISTASTDSEKEFIVEHFIKGFPEEITSKLGVAPVFRTYLLALIAGGFAYSVGDVYNIMLETFYAKHFGDEKTVRKLVSKALNQLIDWGFINHIDSNIKQELSNNKKRFLEATTIGHRVSELYIDPLTAKTFIDSLLKTSKKPKPFSLLHVITSSIELQPLSSIRTREYDWLISKLENRRSGLLIPEPSEFDPEHESFLQSFKTALMLNSWINEAGEEQLLEQYNIRPGELHSKLEIADWLCYSLSELARILRIKHVYTSIVKLRVRLKYGIKEELLPLIALKGIGRVRARKLYNNNIKTVNDLKTFSNQRLEKILGPVIAKKLKAQLTR